MKYLTVCCAVLCFLNLPVPAPADQHSQDAAVGRQVYDDLKAKHQIVPDSPYDAVLQSTGRRIAAAAGPQWYAESFYVIRGNKMNAFPAPGGYVFVTEGLLRNADNVDELANVLGHETAHLVLGQVTTQIAQRRGLFFKIGRFIKSQSTEFQNTFNVARRAGNYMFLEFTRQQEYDADQLGTTLAARAHYNPWGSIWLFDETKRLYGDAGYEQYVKQHPSTEERINRLELYFRAHPGTFSRWPSQLTNRDGLPAS